MKKYITVYDKYIFTQVLITTVVAILLFTIVWIAPEMLLNTIKDVLAGEYPATTGLMILVYELPKILGKAFPVGLLLGSLFTFDKLSKDSELTIFRAVGMSFFRIFAPLFVLSLIFTWLCFITYDRWIPYSCQRLNELRHNSAVTQFIYTQKDEVGHPKQAIVVSKFDNGCMSDVLVMNFSKRVFDDLHGLSNVLVAKTARLKKDKNNVSYWQLDNITSYDIDEDGIYAVNKIKQSRVLNGNAANDAYMLMENSTKRDRDITNSDLKKYIKVLKREGIDEDYRLMLNKYLQRFFHPFVCVVLAAMGCLLGFSKPREQRLVGFTIAIACIFLYYITLPFFDLLAEKGVLHPFIAAIFPPLVFSIAVGVFYKVKDV